MKSIKLKIDAVRDNEEVSGTLSKQRFRHGTWTNEETITVISGQPGSERTILLDDDQRLVIEGYSNVKMVYNREQMVAQPVAQPTPSERPRPTRLPSDEFGDEESPEKPAVERALEGSELMQSFRQEERDRMITAAREKLKAPPPVEKVEASVAPPTPAAKENPVDETKKGTEARSAAPKAEARPASSIPPSQRGKGGNN